jgi:hypothetical protein
MLLQPDTEQIVPPPDRDVLLQLFVARKISRTQLNAGRLWQAQMECAAIQPLRSIDWSAPVSRGSYQPAGQLTDAQFTAMRWRRTFLEFAGAEAFRFLDFCLDGDRGRASIARTLKIQPQAVERYLEFLLAQIPSRVAEV